MPDEGPALPVGVEPPLPLLVDVVSDVFEQAAPTTAKESSRAMGIDH
jgi:hypothetical protein